MLVVLTICLVLFKTSSAYLVNSNQIDDQNFCQIRLFQVQVWSRPYMKSLSQRWEGSRFLWNRYIVIKSVTNWVVSKIAWRHLWTTAAHTLAVTNPKATFNVTDLGIIQNEAFTSSISVILSVEFAKHALAWRLKIFRWNNA
jgi:hypothetical protein